ncbi:LysR family transcriptional regulator [Clostridium sp. BJN0001]|uniref:LysR family transcriptional regulator n=1 Tax=Clostridium sp. BJN0001 TaxID=2930219 RepID=UPI001FD2A8B4|nr:LysR family transcriptional regulator [Clostridium sp. BJN0001]
MLGDLNLYKYFYTAATCRNISRASEILYVSQPAVSKSIKQLESELNIKLFERNSKGVSLTSEGKELYNHIEKAFSEILLGENILTKLKNKEAGLINIGVSTTIGKNYFLPILHQFIKYYPHFKIKIINRPTFDNIELIKSQKVDIAIVGLSNCKDEDLKFIKLKKLHDILVSSPEYLKNLNLNNIDEIFTKASFMLLENPNATRQYIDKYFLSQNLNIVPDIEASNMDFLIECARIGLGITSTLKEFLSKDLENKTLLEIPVNIPIPERNIGIVYKKNSSLPISVNCLIEFLKEYSKSSRS